MQDSKLPVSPQALTVADTNQLPAPLMVSALPKNDEAGNGESGGVNMNGLLQALRRRWLLAGCLALLGAGLAVFGVMQAMPAQYVAITRIQVAFRKADPFLSPVTYHEPDFVIYKAQLAAEIKSRTVIAAALPEIKDLRMIRNMDHPVDELEKSIKTDYTEAPTILKVMLGGDDPEEVTKVVNAVATAFLNHISGQERFVHVARLEKLRDSLDRVKRDLSEKQARLRSLELTHGVKDDASAKAEYDAALAAVGVARKTALDIRLLELKAQEEQRTMEKVEKNLDSAPLPTSLVDERLGQDARGQQLLTNLGAIEKQIIEIRSSVKPPLRDSLVAQEELKRSAALKAVNDLREQMRPDLERALREKMRDDTRINLTKIREELAFLKTQQTLMADEIKRAEADAARLSPNSRPQPQDVLALREEISNTKIALTDIEKTIRALLIEPTQEARVTLLQSAEAPQMRDRSKQMKIGAVAAFGMFGLLLFGVSWLEFSTRKINAADEVVRGLGMNLVGTLPSIPAQARTPVNGKSSARITALRNQLCESVDAIRTMLLHSARTEPLRIVMVTSAQSGEGKTSVASQLAASLARAWRKTLLIDGDLRNPGVHKLFEAAQEPGFSELLRGEVNTADAVRPTSISRLWVMPAGHWDSHAVQALAQDGVGTLFKQLKEEFDFIIVDSSPVLPVNDSLMLGQHVDGVIFSILRDVSRIPAVQAARARLLNLRVRTLGGVVIGDQNTNPTYQYGGQSS